MYNLLSVNNDAKTIKGVQKGYLTGILYLAPNRLLCPACSAGCRKACLFTAGHGQMTSVQKSRLRKTKMFMTETERFKALLKEDIERLIRSAKNKEMTPCVRINGTSDINVPLVFKDLLEQFSDVQFYDYTKVWSRADTKLPSNYHLTLSRSEKTTIKAVKERVQQGFNVAVVFDKVPDRWKGMPVVDGDSSDLRFLDPKGVVVGLKAKGRARKDFSGFVVRVS